MVSAVLRFGLVVRSLRFVVLLINIVALGKMLLGPRKTKFKFFRKTRVKNIFERKYIYPVVGVCALRCLESGIIPSCQLKALNNFSRKLFKKHCKTWLVVFPSWSVTKKPGESRMGKGKGNHFDWVAVVERGRVLLEVGPSKLTRNELLDLLVKVRYKLSVKTEVIFKRY